MIAPNRGPRNWLIDQIHRWREGTESSYLDHSGLTATEVLEQLGVELHPAHDGRHSFGLLPPGLHGATYILFRVDAEGTATITGESITEEGGLTLLNGSLDGSSQRQTEAFYASLDRREAAVPTDVSQPLRAAGYEVIHTGGACLAWFRPVSPDGEDHILITADNDIDGDPDAREWITGRYQLNGWLNIDETFTLDEAIRNAELLPRP